MVDEIDRARNTLYRQMMQVPHRKYAPMVESFLGALDVDPDFTSRALVWLASRSEIRDQVDSAVIGLLQANADQPAFRQAGQAILLGSDVYDLSAHWNGLPPFRIFRVWDYIRQSSRKVPRQMKTLMRAYFAMLENDPRRADGVVTLNRKAMKSVWKTYHFKSHDFPYLHQLLFSKEAPQGSKAEAIQEIKNTDNPREWLRLATENNIPYKTLASILPNTTAAKLVLVGVMSPQEALNSRSWVENSGILNIFEVKAAYLEKVSQATDSVATIEHRASAKGTDRDVERATRDAAQKATERGQRIERDTLLLVDKSSSMEAAFPVARQIGSRVAPICDGELMVIAFNDYAQVIQVEDTHSLAGWEDAFRNVRASGMTSMEAGFLLSQKHHFNPEQIVIVTDGGENVGDLARTLTAYDRTMGQMPHVVIVYTGSEGGRLSGNLQRAGIRFDSFIVTGSDYNVYDQIVAALGGPPAMTIVRQIMETELPRILQ